ncbi:MAG: hypothetical protein A2452_10490 [Candidatus Firestonebacteria bacterium RIFOXYC2_FULL_39_67]|nr:MAG: hypothetical protein A2452_10490 [Candidatus Firestonebacteria bacterium RIFOXYC2_FULL_39_67]OGF58032.1 MAG: hypothetical protein A2497_06790 [Candidatus Firestonebacteria bacterium RifOxyC12_full_39_7]
MQIGFIKKEDGIGEVVGLLRQINGKLGQPGPEKTPNIEKRLLNIREASVMTGLAVGTIYNLVSCRKIPVVRANRKLLFDRKKLEGWIASNSIDPYDKNKSYL